MTLIAVSKLHPGIAIREACQTGQRDFGENYPQELREKAAELRDIAGIRWHAIGPLQGNKAKYVAKVAFAFHALDRIEVAQELSKRREGDALRCYLEVNIASENSKAGLRVEEVAPFLAAIHDLPNLSVVGLMCLPPETSDPESSRPYFRRLRELAHQTGVKDLSMGTTADFETAIEEGATAVRVGSAIFGARPERTRFPST